MRCDVVGHKDAQSDFVSQQMIIMILWLIEAKKARMEQVQVDGFDVANANARAIQ